jgi:hypothetical protein
MGLNKTEGEILGLMGRGKPVPIEKWASVFDMMNVACAAAMVEFAKKGAPRPIKFSESNILVQEYHLVNKVVWTFWMVIKGHDQYYHYTFTLGDKVLGELAVTGKWPAIYAAPADLRVN